MNVMREHAIPQDVTGYRFHIVGNMTLQQFTEVAVGVVIAVVIYKTNLIPIVKWPLILLSGGMGVAIAFVPIEERPLGHWFSTFFNILYRPTQFFWRKQVKIPEPFLYKLETGNILTPEDVDLSPARRERIQEYFTSVHQTQLIDPWEQEQHKRSQSILSEFGSITVGSISAIQSIQKPNLQVRVRELHEVITTTTATLQPEDIVPTQLSAESTSTLEVASQEQEVTSEVEIVTTTDFTDRSPVTPPPQMAKTIVSNPADVANQIKIPVLEETSTKSERVAEEPEKTPAIEAPPATDDSQQNIPQPQLVSSSDQTVFMVNDSATSTDFIQPTIATTHSDQLPFPSKPTVPNKVVGMVFTPAGKILSNAIVEIKNTKGEVARAVKTNPLGQFFITTPLDNGEYVLTTDKEGYVFQDQQLILAGNIIDPIQIVSQA